eukprot:TRINITY_DN296_c0_g1_i4.p1 TRINITY_DN296_c0_g1~~TRINITY_DN296_c0_g1_i4.p1  ORF type:complete len:142 (-),score=10.88 TRINITY_DN296_c0_g1_i4:103-528(-)
MRMFIHNAAFFRCFAIHGVYIYGTKKWIFLDAFGAFVRKSTLAAALMSVSLLLFMRLAYLRSTIFLSCASVASTLFLANSWASSKVKPMSVNCFTSALKTGTFASASLSSSFSQSSLQVVHFPAKPSFCLQDLCKLTILGS